MVPLRSHYNGMSNFIERVLKMDECDLYKLRAEEFERNCNFLRGIEWKVIFQVFAGYALIAAAWSKAKGVIPDSSKLPCVMITSAILLFGLTCWYMVCLFKRISWTRKMQNKYLEKLRETVKADILSVGPEPKFKVCYAFCFQQAISLIIMILIILFIWATK